MSTPKCPGTLSATYIASMELPVRVTNEGFDGTVGNLQPTDAAECIDILEAYTLYCSICHMLTASEYEDHGIADDWEML